MEIEAGGYNPSTAVALRLAVVLDTPVEQLFSLPEDEASELRTRRRRSVIGGSTMGLVRAFRDAGATLRRERGEPVEPSQLRESPGQRTWVIPGRNA